MAEPAAQQAAAVSSRVRALVRAFNKHDVEAIVAMHADDAVWQDPNLDEPATGREAIAAEIRRIFRALPDLHFVIDELEVYTSGGERAASRWHAVGTMTGPFDPPGYAPTGKQVSFSGATFYKFRDGLLQRHTMIYDMLSVAEQAGVLPPTRSAAGRLSVVLQRAIVEVGKRIPGR